MSGKHQDADLNAFSIEIFDKALLLTLLLSILAFLVMRDLPEIDVNRTSKEKIVSIDIPPEVKQQIKLKPPPRPTIPLESESEDIPDDMTIAETVIDTVWKPPPPDDGLLDEDIEYMPMLQSNVDVIKKHVSFVYPRQAREFEIEGTVLVRCFINTEGRVDRVTVLSSIPALDEAAVSMVKQWVFKPAMQGTRPVPIQVNIPVTFKLK